jgi:hemolysin activation/secretion protein
MIAFSDMKLRTFVLVLPLSIFVEGQAFAQSVVLPPEADISRLRLIPPKLPSQENLDLTIRSPEKSVVPKDVTELDFLVTRVQVGGVTYFSEEQVRALFAPLEGRRIRLGMLREQADRLQELYANAGFLLTRVIVPPQRIKSGVVTIEVVEGYIGEISLDDKAVVGGNLAQATLSSLRGQRPLNIRDLDGKLLLLNDIPGLSVKALLRPGEELGSAEMILSTAPTPNQAFLSVSNTGSKAIGPAIYSAGYTVNSPLGRPGALDLTVSAAGQGLQELVALSARYAVPVGSKGIVLYIGGLAAESKPGGESAILDVNTTSYSIETRLRAPIHRSRSSALFVETALLFTRTKVTALEAEITQDNIASSQIGLRGRHQSGWGETTGQIFVTLGLPLFGALDDDAPNPSVSNFAPTYSKIGWQLDHVVQLGMEVSLLTRVAGQWTDVRLLAGEQVAFGGQLLGRSYAPSALTGDRGFGLLEELRIDLPASQVPGLISNVQAYAFADAAQASTLATDDVPAGKQNIQSYGFGLRSLLLNRLYLDVQFVSEGRNLVGGESRPSRVVLNIVSVF